MDDDSGFIMPSAKLGFLPSVPNFQGGPQEY